MGKGSSVVVNQMEMYKAYYTKKFDELMVRENGKIEYKLYKAKTKDAYAIYLKIPSESTEKFYYDVVIEFTSKTGSQYTTLEKYDIRVYSNDQSFIYTFAYAFNKNKMFITELSSKMNKMALTEPPKERTPKLKIGYVKTIYFAYIFMKRFGLLTKLRFAGAETLSYTKISANIMSADRKIQSLNDLKAEQKKKKKETVSAPRTTKIKNNTNSSFTKKSNISKSSTVSKVGKNTSKIKTVKTIKKI